MKKQLRFAQMKLMQLEMTKYDYPYNHMMKTSKAQKNSWREDVKNNYGHVPDLASGY